MKLFDKFYFLINLFLKISMAMAIVGASIATLTSQTFYLFILLVYLKKNLGVNLNFKYVMI